MLCRLMIYIANVASASLRFKPVASKLKNADCDVLFVKDYLSYALPYEINLTVLSQLSHAN